MTYRLLEFPGEQFAGLHHLRVVLKVLEHFRGDFRKILKFFRGHPAGRPAVFAGSAVAANEAGGRGAVKENRAHHPELKIAQKRFSGYRAPLSPIYHDQVLKTPQRSTRSRSSFPTLKKGNFLPSTLMRSPVLGLRPV